MAHDFLPSARRERDDLLKELERLPAFRKYQRVTALIAEYAADEEADAKAINPPPARIVKAVPQKVPSRENSKLAQVEKVVLDHMWHTGKRFSSGQLLPVLAAAKIEMGGKVPSKTLASMLSNSQRLNNLKGFGYGPFEWGDRPAVKDEAPADLLASATKDTGETPSSVFE
ncbi:MAG: hypothetical protein KF723_15355 [Rhizobiaceae bacterium]|nr:hypothetical protein [Rhizobiaceae bacterium]